MEPLAIKEECVFSETSVWPILSVTDSFDFEISVCRSSGV